MTQAIPPNSDQRVSTLRSEIFHANRLKNVLLTIITLGYHYRNTLYNKAQTLLGRLNSLDVLQNTVKNLKQLELPPHVKTHKDAVDHIYSLLGDNFKTTYSEEFLRSMIKTTLVAQPNPQVTTHAQWKQLKTDMRAKIQGSEGNHHIPTLQKWKGLESLMKEIHSQIMSGNQNILRTLQDDPNFSTLYTTRELKGLLKMAKKFHDRGQLENFRLNPKILQDNYQAFWVELMGITESEKTIRNENNYHLLDTKEIPADLSSNLTLGDLATADSRLYLFIHSKIREDKKSEIRAKITDDMNSEEIEQIPEFTKLFSADEKQLIISELSARSNRGPIPVEVNVQQQSVEIDQNDKASSVKGIIQQTFDRSNREYGYSKRLSDEQESVSWTEFSSEKLQRDLLSTPGNMLNGLTTYDGTDEIPEVLESDQLVVCDGFMRDFPRKLNEIQFYFYDKDEFSSTVSIPKGLPQSETVISQNRTLRRYREIFDLFKLLEKQLGAGKNHSLIKSLQIGLMQCTDSDFFKPISVELMCAGSLGNPLSSVDDPNIEFHVLDDKKIHQVIHQPGSLRDPKTFQVIGTFIYTVELDHVKDETGQWKIVNVTMTDCTVKMD